MMRSAASSDFDGKVPTIRRLMPSFDKRLPSGLAARMMAAMRRASSLTVGRTKLVAS
jgi:hypothetical protein